LRFPEFRDAGEWEEKRLGDYFTENIRIIEKPPIAYTGLGIRSHGKGTFLKEEQDPLKNSMENLYKVEKNDLIVNITFAWEGAIAIASDCDDGALVSHRFPTYVGDKSDTVVNFFRYIIITKRFFHELFLISPGGAGRNRVMNKKDFLKIKISAPRKPEQQKIAVCLSSLDELIAAHNQKLAALKLHKKGLMQQLFPAEGETVPRLRFPEFRAAGEWEEKDLNTLGELVSGLTYSPGDVCEDGLLVLRSSNVQNGRIVLDDNVFVRSTIKGANPSMANDILICVRNGSKTLIGKNALIPKGLPPCTHGAFMTVFRSKSAHFVIQLFQTESYEKQVAADLGATINSINGNQFKKYTFFVPGPKEQQKIANCLSSLDELIAAQVQKIEALKTHKKALMQQLFPATEEVQG